MFVPEKSREILGRVRCKVEEAIMRPQGGSLQPFNGRCSLVGGDLVKSSQDAQMVMIVLQFCIFRHCHKIDCPIIIIMLWFGFGNQWLPCYSQFGRMFHHLPNFPSPLNGVGAFLSVSRLFHNAAYRLYRCTMPKTHSKRPEEKIWIDESVRVSKGNTNEFLNVKKLFL